MGSLVSRQPAYLKSWSIVSAKAFGPDQNLHSPMKRFFPSGWRTRMSDFPLTLNASAVVWPR
jgi:hypothetical protein